MLRCRNDDDDEEDEEETVFVAAATQSLAARWPGWRQRRRRSAVT